MFSLLHLDVTRESSLTFPISLEKSFAMNRLLSLSPGYSDPGRKIQLLSLLNSDPWDLVSSIIGGSKSNHRTTYP